MGLCCFGGATKLVASDRIAAPQITGAVLIYKIGKRMKSKDTRDIIGGFALVAIGLFAALHAQRYELGELQAMGPGYFPTALGILLIIFGLFIAIPAFFREGTSIHPEWKSLIWVLLSIVIFAVALRTAGVIIATILSVLAASIPSKISWKVRIILALCIALIIYAVFIFGLGMILPVWPWSY